MKPLHIVALIITAAIVAVVIAPNSKTGELIQAMFSTLSNLLSVVVAPIKTAQANAARTASGGASLLSGNPFATGANLFANNPFASRAGG